MANEINVQITFDPKTGEFKTGLGKLEHEAGKSGKAAGENFEKGFTKSASSGLSLLSPKFVALAAAASAALAGKTVISAAIKQQESVNSLNQSLKSAGTFSLEASQRLQDFASTIQRTTTIGDETTLSLLALSRNFTRSNDEARKLTQAAIELSAATGISLEGAVKNLGKTFSGLTGELGESLPGIKTLSKEALQSGQALDLVLSRFGGSAAGQVNTFSGSLQQAANLFGDLLETLGDIIIKSPVAAKTISFISGEINKAIESVKEFGKQGDPIQSLTQQVANFGMAVVNFVVAPVELAVNIANVAFNGIKLFIQSVITNIADGVGFIADLIAKLPGQANNPVVQALQQFRESSNEVLNQTVQDSNTAMASLFNFDFSVQAADFVARYDAAVNGINDVNNRLQENTKKTGEDLTKTVRFASVQIGDQLNQGFGRAVASSIQFLAQNLAKGKNIFENFGKFVLGLLGDLAVQIGTFIIATSIAKAALFESPAAGIAAGAALIVIGTLLKTLSGGQGSLGGAAAPAAGGAGGGAVPIGETVPTPPEDVTKEEQKVVNVTFAGPIFDSEQTGKTIVDLINKEVRDNNAVLVQPRFV